MTDKHIKHYRAGYVFKPTHEEIHYIKKDTSGYLRHSYEHNFTTNKNDALVGSNLDKAKSAIVSLVSKFPENDEYVFTPVLVNIANNTFQRYLNGRWLNEAIRPLN